MVSLPVTTARSNCSLVVSAWAQTCMAIRWSGVGTVWINSWFLRDLRTPFGGCKQSGIGREGGMHSMEFYTELRNVCVST